MRRTGVVGPAVRFAVAVLHAFEVRNDRDRPFSAETLAAYWYSARQEEIASLSQKLNIGFPLVKK